MEEYLRKVLVTYIKHTYKYTSINDNSNLPEILSKLEQLKKKGGKTLRLKNRTKKTRKCKNKKNH